MKSYYIGLRNHDGIEAFFATQSLGTRALNAVGSLPGVKNPRIVRETEERVEIEYDWAGGGALWTAGEHLQEYGLKRADSD